MSVNEKMTAIADAIREKTGGTEKLTLDDMPEQIGSIKVEEDMLKFATTARFGRLDLFGKAEVIINVPYLATASSMFVPSVTNTIVEHITVNGTQPTNANAMFNMNWYGGVLSHVTLNMDFSKCTNATAMFNNHGGIVIIDGTPLDFSSCTTRIDFLQLSKLEHIRFAPGSLPMAVYIQHSSNLTDASIQSIVDGLADLTGATAQKVSFHTDVLVKLTDEQALAIAAKNWTM